jgi:hypothetical protein
VKVEEEPRKDRLVGLDEGVWTAEESVDFLQRQHRHRLPSQERAKAKEEGQAKVKRVRELTTRLRLLQEVREAYEVHTVVPTERRHLPPKAIDRR